MAQLQVYSNKLAFTHALNYARTTATPDMIFFCADNRDHCCIWYCADHRVVFVFVCRLYADNRDMETFFFPRGQPQPMPISANFRGPPRYFKPSFYTRESI